MADEIYFFTRSYTYDTDAVASTSGTSVGVNLPALAIDKDQSTYWETTDAAPALKIDLSEAQTIDSLWFKSSNVSKYRLYYSTDDIVYNAAFAEQNSLNGVDYQIELTPRTARYWRLDVTEEDVVGTNTIIYEVLLMEHRLTLDGYDSHPSKLNIMQRDRIGGAYNLADGSATSYSGEKAYTELEFTFSFTPQANRDNLYDLYSTPTLRPSMTIYPEPDAYSSGIYQVVWADTDFNLVYAIGYTGSGFNGNLRFSEY